MAAQARKPVLVSWSGGKDSCLALHEVLSAGTSVEALITTVTRDFDRISMHGVRRVLLERQATSLGLLLREVVIGKGASNDDYESALSAVLLEYRERGMDQVVFGDLFLADIRAYRDRLLDRLGMTGLYPVWNSDTAATIGRFLSLGYRTVVVCVDPVKLDPSFAGRTIDQRFLADLPAGVDPCGENGEFHTFAFDGPIFRSPVRFALGELVERDGFWFRDLLPEG